MKFNKCRIPRLISNFLSKNNRSCCRITIEDHSKLGRAAMMNVSKFFMDNTQKTQSGEKEKSEILIVMDV